MTKQHTHEDETMTRTYKRTDPDALLDALRTQAEEHARRNDLEGQGARAVRWARFALRLDRIINARMASNMQREAK